MPNKRPHNHNCPKCKGRWDHLRMACMSCGFSEPDQPEVTNQHGQKQSDTIPPVQHFVMEEIHVKHGERTPLRATLNRAIARARELELSTEQMKHLTGLSGNCIKYVMDGCDVHIKIADDFIAGLNGATKSLLTD